MTATSTGVATLQIELNFDPRWRIQRLQKHLPKDQRPRLSARVRPEHVSNLLDDVGWLGGAAKLVALGEGNEQGFPYQETSRVQAIRRAEPTLLKVEYGSPFKTLVAIGREITQSAGGLGFLVVGLKRLWSIDLELKTDRLEKQALFYEAQERALQAEARLDAARRKLSDERQERDKAKTMEVAERKEWGTSFVDEFRERRNREKDWRGRASLSIDETRAIVNQRIDDRLPAFHRG